MDGNSASVQRFSVPKVIAVSAKTHRSRGRINAADYTGSIVVNPVRLEELDGELYMELEIKLDGQPINDRYSILVIPELAGADGSHETAAGLLVNGKIQKNYYRRCVAFGNERALENLPDMKIAITSYTNSLIRYNIQMPYSEWMDDAVLNVHLVYGSPAGREQLYSLTNAGRVKLQQREPYQIQPSFSFITPAPEQKQRKVQGQAFLDFASGSAVIQPGYRRNPEELAKIQAAISAVNNDPDVDIIGLFVEGYASPDGSYTTNERLARERSEALSNYIAQNYGVESNIIRTSSVAEDWDGLRLMVEESDIARRDDILNIIDGADEPDRKEQRLRSLGTPWTVMNSTMLPSLRRVEYQIDFTVKDYTLEESRDLAGRNPELLSQRELFLLAQTYDAGSTEEARMHETIIRLYPDDDVAILNYSAILLARGETATAKRYLDRVADNPDAANSLGVYYLLSGDLDQAEQYLLRAQANGVEEAAANLAELARKREDNIRMERYKK